MALSKKSENPIRIQLADIKLTISSDGSVIQRSLTVNRYSGFAFFSDSIERATAQDQSHFTGRGINICFNGNGNKAQRHLKCNSEHVKTV